MLDIIFISYDEANADKNFATLRNRFPYAKRVHGVKGIANAHLAASKKANTKFFYVVDGDSEVLSTFDFSFKPEVWDENYVHIWHAFNPAIGIDYGYGGIKLFNKSFFKNIDINNLDFSTTLTSDIKIIDEIASITNFNSDSLRAFRGAFREAVKLTLTIENKNKSKSEIAEAKERLKCWQKPKHDCRFEKLIISGVYHGIKAASKSNKSFADVMYINNMESFNSIIREYHANVFDDTLDPTPREGNPMKHEFFFTARIAGILYDPYVKEHLPLSELRDAISDGQLLSKNWLVEILVDLLDKKTIKLSEGKELKVAILGGWLGTLALMINVRELPFKVTSIDLDGRANTIAEKLNYDFNFNTSNEDMYNVDYSKYDIIINTASEHIPSISEWRSLIPDGKIIIVQNNNFLEGEGHISNVENSAQLGELLNLRELLYEGTRRFKQYDRYMLIGRT
jgi:hypothetical protein